MSKEEIEVTEQNDRDTPPAERPALAVRVVAGPDERGLHLAVDRPLLVGTSPFCDLKINDRRISRRHLTLEPAADGIRVKDEGSRNGTFHGEVRLYEAVLRAGAELRLGETTLRVEPPREKSRPVPPASRDHFGRFHGSAPALARVYAELERAAASDATVLLEGESGTGKELLAEAIHEHSRRSAGPFVVVDCGAVSETLIESQLFGHEQGAFTGADRRRVGAFEEAQGGTIFLDELGELPLALQTRLLRVLDRRQVRRLGSETAIDVDVRVIAATNRNLDREVEEGRFRVDLFHRLAVILVRVPPLRDRPEDIAPLAQRFAQAFGGARAALPPELLTRLRRSAWPGNTRELRNYVERYCLLGELPSDEELTPISGDPLRDAAVSGLPYRLARERVLEAFTGAYVDDMLKRHNGNVSRAARAAGVARRHFHRLKRILMSE